MTSYSFVITGICVLQAVGLAHSRCLLSVSSTHPRQGPLVLSPRPLVIELEAHLGIAQAQMILFIITQTLLDAEGHQGEGSWGGVQRALVTMFHACVG